MSEWTVRLAGPGGKALITGLYRSLRIRREGYGGVEALRDQGVGIVYVFWHAHLMSLTWLLRYQGVVPLVSEHRDGEYIARVLERFGFGLSRGSSTRGGSGGLRGLVRAAREGRELAVTPDGPRGPAREFKPGALVAARLTGHRVVPVGIGATRAWRLDSWDRFMIPKPFARLTAVFGAPVEVPRELDDAGVAALAREMGATLDRLGRRAGDPLIPPEGGSA